MDQTVQTQEGSISLSTIITIAHSAGAKILDIYNGNQSNWQVDRKADNSPLTIADRAANTEICKHLQNTNPLFPIMSEENKQAAYEDRKGWKAYWCVDPLDGTKEFLKRNGEFTVNIALMEAMDLEKPEGGAKAILGVVYVPVSGKVYFGGRDVGAYMANLEKDGSATGVEKIECAKFSEEEKGLKIVCSRSHLDDRTKEIMSKYKESQSVSMGSSLKFMLIAEGKAHVYPRMAPTMEWDTAASQIIVEQAGGEVLRAEDYSKMVYNKENLLNPFFICYGNRAK